MRIENSKKGSYIMEAAVVLPIIILVTITAVLIIMFFYSQMTERSKMHTALRSEAGAMTEQTLYLHSQQWDGEIYGDKEAIGGKAYGKKYLIMLNNGILRKKGTFRIEGWANAVNGPQYVRYCNLVKGAVDEE